jgi:hypothetical protein
VSNPITKTSYYYMPRANIMKRLSYLLNMINVLNIFKILFENVTIMSHGNYMPMIHVIRYICPVRNNDGFYNVDNMGWLLL